MTGISYGGPAVCSACRTLMHEPTEACPNPHECLVADACAICREARYHGSRAWGR